MLWVRVLFAIGAAAVVAKVMGEADPNNPFIGRLLLLVVPMVFLNAMVFPFPYYVPQYMFTLVLFALCCGLVYDTEEMALGILPVFLTLANVSKTIQVFGHLGRLFSYFAALLITLTVYLFYSDNELSVEIGNVLANYNNKKSKPSTSFPIHNFLVDDGTIFTYPEYISLLMGGFSLFFLFFTRATIIVY